MVLVDRIARVNQAPAAGVRPASFPSSRTACHCKGQQAPVVDEKQVILAHPHFELLDVERTVSDAAYKRVLVLRLPD